MKLSDMAIKVGMSISQWSGMAQEKKGAEMVEEQAGATRGVVRARKYVLPGCDELKAVHSFNNALRQWFYEQTLPWDDFGGRILPAANSMEFLQSIGAKRKEGEALADAFTAAYPSWYQRAQLSLGDLWDPKSYPSPDHIRDKFGYSFVAEPLPETESLRNYTGVGPTMVDKLIEESNAQMQARLQQAQADVWKRVYETTNAMAERLSVPIGAQGAVFRDSLVNNLVDLVDLVPKLNVVADPTVNAMVEDIRKKLLGVQPDALRIDPDLRAERAARARELAERARGMM